MLVADPCENEAAQYRYNYEFCSVYSIVEALYVVYNWWGPLGFFILGDSDAYQLKLFLASAI